MPDGFSLNIDPNFLRDLAKADAAIEKLIDKNNTLAHSTITAFQKMSNSGVIPYIKELETRLNALQSISSSIGDKPAHGMVQLKYDVSNAIDVINKLIISLKDTKQYASEMSSELAKTSMKLVEASNDEFRMVKSLRIERENNTKRELNEYQQIIQKINELTEVQKRASQVINAPQNSGMYNAAKQAYTESVRQIEELNNRKIELEKKYEVEIQVLYEQNAINRFNSIQKNNENEIRLEEDKRIKLAKEYEKELEDKRRAERELISFAKNASKRYTSDIQREEQLKVDSGKKSVIRDYQERFKLQEEELRRSLENVKIKREAEIRLNDERISGILRANQLDEEMAQKAIKRNSEVRASLIARYKTSGDLSNNAMAAYERLSSGKGVLSVNNISSVLSKLQQAQGSINLKTKEGRDRYEEIGNAIKNLQSLLNAVGTASERNLQIAEKESKVRASLFRYIQSSGDTTKQADAAYNRIYGDKGVQSVANFKNVLSSLELAQSKINQRTEEGRKKYDEFEVKINRVKQSIEDLSNRSKKAAQEEEKSNNDRIKSINDLLQAQSKYRAFMYSYRQRSGDTSNQAIAAYNRLYGEHGVKSVNNMNRALQRLQDAQNKLNLKTDKGRQKYDELGKKIQQIKRDLDKATQANEKFHNSHSKLLNTTYQLQRKLALLFSVSAIQGYMDKLVNVRKEFELQQKSLQVLLRDKDQADKLWQQTIDLAVKSPFRVSQLVSYTKQLAAYRIESDKLYDTTKMLSDVSAGLGVDMQRIILAFGQVRAANFLRGTELRQFTEAGIPMLDELAQMFTELEGRVVKAGDVFERISKRMVTFRDVEEVFKRMTSSSGVFYNMQEEQSKTLFGMISNLHDSIDLMLNDIGRSNDGIIKDMVSLTRDLVENWRGVATVLKQVGVTLAMIGLAKFVTGWRIASTAIATGSTSAALAMNGMAGSAARLRIAMSTLGKTISAHPWFLLVGVVASAGHALWEYIEAIDAANAKYDDMSRREIAHIDQLEELQKKTEQYNAIIEDGTSSEQARNKAQLENDKILSQIKAKYPELYPLIIQQKNKTIDLTKAIERQNEVLEVNIALQQKAKGNFFQEDFSENYKDALESQDALKSSLVSLQSEASQASVQLKKLLANGEISKDVANDFDRLFKSIRKAKNFEEAKEYVYELSDAFEKIGNDANIRLPLFDIFDDVRNKFAELNSEQINYTNSLSTWGENLDNQMDAFRIGIEDAMDGLSSDEANKKATQWVNQQLDALGVVDKELKKWAQQYIVRETGIELNFVDEGKKVYTEADLTKEWQKKIWGAIKKVESTNPDIRLGVTLEDVATQDLATVIKTLRESVESAIKENKNVVDVGKIVGQVAYTPQQIQNAKDSVEPLQALADVIGLIIKQTSGNKGKDWMSEVVKGIKEAHQEYIKLNKTLDDSEAKQLALNKYAKSFAESAKNAGLKDISLGQFKFETEEGAIEALTFLKNKLPKSAKQARFKLEEAIGEIRGEVRIRTKAEDDKLLIEQIEDMFSGYEMSIELQKLNIPPDLAKQLFNIDTLTLPELKNKVISMESQFVGTDMEEEYRKFLKKIDEMEEKAQMERLKKYSKYLAKAQSERVKIKLEEMRQLAEIEKLGFNETQKEQITQSIQLETKQKMDKAEWEAFKDTDLYVQMFEDLGVVSDKVLNDLKTRLIDIRGSLSDLSPRELKEVVSQLEKVTSEQISRNPFENLGDTIDKGVKALKRLNQEQEEYSNALKEQEVTQNRVDSLQIANKQAEAQMESAKAILLSKDATIKQRNEAQHIISISKSTINQNDKLLDVEIKRLATQKGITEAAARKLILTRAEVSELNKTANSVGVWGSTITDSVSQVTSMLENCGIDFGEEFEGVLSGLGQAFGALENIDLTKPMSVISGVTRVVAGLGNAFASIFGFGNKDKKKEKQIQREIKFVEDLERAYEKLEKAIDNAYSINTLQANGQAAKKNIDAQIASYNKMIEAEEDKKDTDEDRIKEWQLAIEDLIEQKAELDKELVSVATSGIMDDVLSASQEFTNAWLEAFNETGDGLSGLEANFKETMLEMVKQQAAMLISQAYVDKWKKQLEQYINPDDLELSTDEAKKWVDAVSNSLPQLNDALTRYFEAMKQAGVDLSGGEQSDLSGLQRGISGITESQADILAAYANSCRFFLANIDTTLASIANQILGGGNMPNPMLSELKTQTEMIRAIRDMFSSVIRNGHPTFGGAFIKVAL